MALWKCSTVCKPSLLSFNKGQIQRFDTPKSKGHTLKAHKGIATHCWGWGLQDPVPSVTDFNAFNFNAFTAYPRQTFLNHELSYLLSLLILGSPLILGKHSLFCPVLSLLITPTSGFETLTQPGEVSAQPVHQPQLLQRAEPVSLQGPLTAAPESSPSTPLPKKQGQALSLLHEDTGSIFHEQGINHTEDKCLEFSAKPPAQSQQGRIQWLNYLNLSEPGILH